MRAISSFKSIWCRELLDVRRGRILEASLLLIRGRQKTSSPPKKSWLLEKAAKKVETDLMYGHRTMRAEIWMDFRYCMNILHGLEAAASASRTFVPLPVKSVATYPPTSVIGGRYMMFQNPFNHCRNVLTDKRPIGRRTRDIIWPIHLHAEIIREAEK